MRTTQTRLLAAALCVLLTLGLAAPAGAAPAMGGEDHAVAEIPGEGHVHGEEAAIPASAEGSRGGSLGAQAQLLEACCSAADPHEANTYINVSKDNAEHWITHEENASFVLHSSSATSKASFALTADAAVVKTGGKLSYTAVEKCFKMYGATGDATVTITDDGDSSSKYTVTVHVVDAEYVPPCADNAHVWVDVAGSDTATCEDPGVKTQRCSVCKSTQEVPTTALGHDLQDMPGKEATCMDAGYNAYQACSRCDYIEGKTEIPATGKHNNEGAGGVCSVCGYETHTQHSYTILVNDTATCTDDGEKTLRCDKTGCQETTTQPSTALGHDWTETEHKDATCTLPGVVGGKHCERCNTQELGAGETPGSTVGAAIPATGHSYDPGSTQCKVCGEEKTSFTVQGGDFEVAYAQWPIEPGIDAYTVYVASDADNYTAYTQVDRELVREYTGYMRVDAMGLKAGNYKLKVVPIKSGAEQTAMVTDPIAVKAHDRSGFGFAGTQTPGAYKADGTLKDNAVVLYITEETKDTVTMDVITNNKGATTTSTGLQTILNAYKKGYENRPLDIRLIGNITDPAVLEGGDIVIETGKSNNNSPVTIEGVGNDAVANGWGIRVKNANYVEIANLGFMNTDASEGDNIGVQQGVNYVWIHNNDLFYGGPGGDSDQAKGDGAMDFKNSYYATFSYNHFWDTGKSSLLGMKNDQNYTTYHHNWFDHSDSRHPRIRIATSVHIYNNYYDGNSKYGVGAALNSNAFVDSNYFRNTKYPMLSSMQGSDVAGGNTGTFSGENGGVIKAYGNVIVGSKDFIPWAASGSASTDFDAYVVEKRTDTVPSTVKAKQGGTTYTNFDTSGSLYIDSNYPIQTAADCVATVTEGAGRVQGGDLQYEFDDVTEDSNYGVIQELKSMLLNYAATVLSAGGQVTQNATGEVTHTHTPSVWKVTKAPGCNPATQELVNGEETQTCTTCGEVLSTRSIAGAHSNDGSGKCTVCGYETGNGGGAVVSGASKVLKYSDFSTSADKQAITADEMETKADGYFTVFGSVNKRTKTGTTTMSSLQLAKGGGGGFAFTVTNAPATVTVIFSGVDSSKASWITLEKDGTAVADKNGDTYPKSSNSKDQVTTVFNLTEAGSYRLTSHTGDENNMDARVYTLSVTETDEDSGGDDASETVSLTQRLTNLTSSTSATRVYEGQPLTITLRVAAAAANDYELPDTVSVTVGGEELSGVYNKSTGVISLSADQVTASIVITAAAQPKESAGDVSVTGVTLNIADLALTIGETATLTHSIQPANATNQTVTWASSNAAVASVTSAGLVTALKAGVTTVSVTTQDGSYTAECTVTVSGGEDATTYVLTGEDLHGAIGDNPMDKGTSQAELGTAKFFTVYAGDPPVDGDKDNRTIAESLSKAKDFAASGEFAAYSANYRINFKGSGISYDAAGGKVYGAVGFTTTGPATVKIWGVAGNNDRHFVILNDKGETVVTGETTAEKNSDLLEKLVLSEPGVYYLGSTPNSNYIYRMEVAVSTPDTEIRPADVSVAPATGTLYLDGVKTVQLTATVTPEGASQTVVWSSSDSTVANVDANGLVTGLKAGSATITATTANGKTATCAITVTTRQGGSTTVDKKALEAAIEAAEALDLTLATSENGSDVATTDQWVTPEMKQDVETALAAAKALVKDSAATQEAVDAALKALTDATAAYQPAAGLKPADKDDLRKALEKAQDVYDVADDTSIVVKPENTKPSAVDKGTKFVWDTAKEALWQAITEAQAVLESENPSAQEIADAINALREASDGLVIYEGTKSSYSGGSGGGRPSGGTDTGDDKTDGDTGSLLPDAPKTTAKKTTDSEGNTTVTVTDEDGEVLAQVQLPANVPELDYTFEDVADDAWYADAVNTMAAMGVVEGTSTTRHIFEPTADITRGAMVQILFNLSHGKEGLSENFTDVAAGAWYTDAVAWAAASGVVNGYMDNSFGPGDAITREQLATMLYRYAALLGLDTKVENTAALNGFVDASSVQSWAADAMSWAVANGLIQGKGANNLDPAASASRAETVAILQRFLDVL